MSSLLIEDEKRNSDNNSKEEYLVDQKKDNSYNFGHRNDFGDIIDIKVKNSKRFSVRNTISINETKNNIFNRFSNLLTNNKEEQFRNSSDLNINKKNSNDFAMFKRSKSNLIQEELMEMGYELFLINNLMKFFEISTIELAIDYLSKTNNKWNHPFLYFEIPENQIEDELAKLAKEENLKSNLLNKNKFGKNEIKCYVCGDNADLHLEYSKYKTSNGNSITHYDDYESKNQIKTNKSVDPSIFQKPELLLNLDLEKNPKGNSNENSLDKLIEKNKNDSENIGNNFIVKFIF